MFLNKKKETILIELENEFDYKKKDFNRVIFYFAYPK